MNVCILTETYYPVIGGGERQAQSLAAGLVDMGFGVIVLTRRSHASLKKTERLGNVTVYRLSPVGSHHFKKWGLLLTSALALIKLRQQYDAIFVSGFRIIGLSAVLVSKLLDKTCVLKADSLGEMSGDFFAAGLAKLHLGSSWPPFQSFLRLRNYLLRRADSFVAISAEVVKELVSHGVNADLIQEIPNGVDTATFRPICDEEKQRLRQKLGLPEQATIVIFTGRLVSYKGLPLLLRVWRTIQGNHRPVRLLLVGTGGLDLHNCEAELRTYASANGLQNSVQFTGGVHNVSEYLQASDIFVFPSENEAFPLAPLEAMACGLPVIATSVGGLKDILQHGQNGWAVQPGDFQQLREALEGLMGSPWLAAQLGQAARRTVTERYSADSVTAKYVELFSRIHASAHKAHL